MEHVGFGEENICGLRHWYLSSLRYWRSGIQSATEGNWREADDTHIVCVCDLAASFPHFLANTKACWEQQFSNPSSFSNKYHNILVPPRTVCCDLMFDLGGQESRIISPREDANKLKRGKPPFARSWNLVSVLFGEIYTWTYQPENRRNSAQTMSCFWWYRKLVSYLIKETPEFPIRLPLSFFYENYDTRTSNFLKLDNPLLFPSNWQIVHPSFRHSHPNLKPVAPAVVSQSDEIIE